MDSEEFIEKFAELFDDTPAGEINADTVFKDLDEWSSILGLGVVSMVGDEYDVALTGIDLKNIDTVGQLFELVKSRM
ncbi:MAG: acyl carrier protein [Bacteroidales bacterium]|nr:acyl carrier protein [Bacteroidales bacterium]